jgi:hypothetical protein
MGMIPLIHSRFTNLLAMLTARHENIDDKQDILFDTYRVSPNETFQLYMKQREEECPEDHPNMCGADYQVIMRKALQKYNLTNALHQWDKLSPEQESIIALKAELAAVKGDALKLSKKLEDIRTNPKKPQAQAVAKAKANPQQGDTNPKQQQPNKGGGKKNKKNTSNKQRQKAQEAWQKIPPKPGEQHTKQVNGKTWRWCEFHMSWTIHTPDECRKNPKNQLQASNVKLTEDKNEDDGPTGLEQMMATLAIAADGAT